MFFLFPVISCIDKLLRQVPIMWVLHEDVNHSFDHLSCNILCILYRIIIIIIISLLYGMIIDYICVDVWRQSKKYNRNICFTADCCVIAICNAVLFPRQQNFRSFLPSRLLCFRPRRVEALSNAFV